MAQKTESNRVEFEKDWAARVKKEKKHQKLFTKFSINPFVKKAQLTEKPNIVTKGRLGDTHFKEVLRRAELEPTKKYDFPQTESQELGWRTQPLIPRDRTDRRLEFPRIHTGITDYMEAVWEMNERAEK